MLPWSLAGTSSAVWSVLLAPSPMPSVPVSLDECHTAPYVIGGRATVLYYCLASTACSGMPLDPK